MLSEEIEKSTNGEVKARLHLSGTLQIAPNNITPAVAEGVVQIADDLFNSGNIPLAGIPRLPGLVRNYEEFAKCADVLRPYLEKAFAEKGIVMLADYTYPLQVIWGRKKLTSLEDIKGTEAARRAARAGRDGAPLRRHLGDDFGSGSPLRARSRRGRWHLHRRRRRRAVEGPVEVRLPDPGELEQLLHPRQRRSVQQALARPASQATQGRAGCRQMESGHDADRGSRLREGADRGRLHHDDAARPRRPPRSPTR